MVSKHSGILLRHKKEGNDAIRSNTHGSRHNRTKQSKSERERQIPYDITYVWNLNMAQANLSTKRKQTHSHRE